MKRRIFMGMVGLALLTSSCTFINKQSYEINHPPSTSPEKVMDEMVSYFTTLGFKLERRTHVTYPNDERFASFFLGKQSRPLLYTSFDHVVLRLESEEHLYLDWIRISDIKEQPPPGYFDPFYRKVTDDLEKRVGGRLLFKLIREETS